MNRTRLDITLEQFEIGLSGAVPDRKDWSEPAMDRAILEFIALFSGIIFKYGGRIVHGSHPTFTPVILRQARLHAGKRHRKPVTLVMSDLWAAALNEEQTVRLTETAELLVTRKVGSGGVEDAVTRNKSLSAMRRMLVDSQNVMVAVGGKMHRADGIVPGVGEELDLAARKGMPRFLVAGMGGYAGEYAKEILPDHLNNGLSDDDNELLFTANDVAACVAVIFEHLARSPHLIEFQRAPIKWNADLKTVLDHRDGTVDVEAAECLLYASV